MSYSTNGHYDAETDEWRNALFQHLPDDRRYIQPARMAALPAAQPDPTADAIEAALSGNISNELLGTLHAAALQRGETSRRLRFREALEAAESTEETDRAIEDFTVGSKPKSRLEIVSSVEFDAANYSRKWLVEFLLAEQEPLVIGGPRKSLKTTLMLDLAISVASGTPFLGKWEVRQALPVGVVSAESGPCTLQETARRIAFAKGVNLAKCDNLFWSFNRPLLSDPKDVAALKQFVRSRELKVLLLDPLYLIMGGDVEAGSVFDMGPRYRKLAEIGDENGCLVGIAHHTVKNRTNPYAKLELDDLQWSGAAEFARQWLLVSRREAYDGEHPGQHMLQVNFGGSAGHAGHVAVDVNEGDVSGGRRWDVAVRKMSDVCQERDELFQVAKDAKRATKSEATAKRQQDAVIAVLSKNPNVALTKRQIRASTRQSGDVAATTLDALLMAEIVTKHREIRDGSTVTVFQLSEGWDSGTK